MLNPQFSVDFSWSVVQEGYHWILEKGGGDPRRDVFLTDGIPIGAHGNRVRRYFPIREHSGLFRAFAFTAPDRESIKAFADRYGTLMKADQSLIPLRKSRDAKGYAGAGERFSLWYNEILEMRRAVQLSDWARSGDIKALQKHIFWNANEIQYSSHPGRRPEQRVAAGDQVSIVTIASNHHDEGALDRFERDDVIRPALFLTQRLINQRLIKETSLRLLWNSDGSALVNRVMPRSLLGAMWFQFSVALERNSDFRQCAECGDWFELSPGTARSDKLFCSTACRVKAFRRRKSEQDVSLSKTLATSDAVLSKAKPTPPARRRNR